MRQPRTTWSLLGVLTGLLALVLTGLAAGPTYAAPAPSAAPAPPAAPPSAPVDLGPNVKVFDPSMSTAQIQATADAVYAQQVDAEMGTGRYALLFKPGVYGSAQQPLIIKVGYYTEVAGLGANPGDVTLNGHVDVYNRCLGDEGTSNCLALVNFWRSMSNLTINVVGETGCRASGNFWAVSQAAPMRRVDVNGPLTLMDYCTAGPQYASGGFIADSRVRGNTVNGSQQQFLVRDSSINGWSNGVWNQVFSGVEGAPTTSFPDPPYTTLDATPVSRERPYLWVDGSGSWQVFVPGPRTGSSGTTWAPGPTPRSTPGRSVPVADFFVASPSTPWAKINAALAQGRNLLLLPGVYDVGRTIDVKRAHTVVLGLGLPTLTAVDGAVPLQIADVPGVDVAGLTIDAGATTSPALLRVGTGRGKAKASDPANPTALQDVFFRIGGPHVGTATVALEVNSDHVVLDDIWAWRADHGVPGSVGWTVNTSDTGVVVNGDDVTATGLFSEHFQKENVIWSGERGQTVFFQNELPYDPPNQAAWQHDGILGYAAYKVTDNVQTHTLWGGGSYIFTNVDPTVHATHGFEVPTGPGIAMHSLLTVQLSAGTIDHVVNDVGAPTGAVGKPSTVVTYP